MNLQPQVQALQEMIDRSHHIVAFTGAGCSTESGIPDFRSVDGLYHQKYDYPPEVMLSHTFYEKHPAEFFRFYRHQRAGSRVVYELHGSVLRNFCERCKKAYPVEAVLDSTDVPRCSCGGRIKPDVVLYEEGLDSDTVSGAIQAISRADMLIVGGTSLVVYPAAGLIQYYTGNRLVVINKSDVGVGADLVINGAIGEVLSQIQV